MLNLLGRTEEAGELTLDLSAFPTRNGEATGVRLAADSLLSMNRLGDMQITESPASLTVKDGRITCTVPPLSFSEFIIPLAP